MLLGPEKPLKWRKASVVKELGEREGLKKIDKLLFFNLLAND